MRSLIFLVGGIALQGCTTSAPVVRTATVVTSRPTTEWQLVPGWPRLAPGVRLGEVSGVDLDRRGHVMVFHRAGRAFDRTATEPIAAPTVVELDALTGDVINSWGAGLFLIPHSITVDSRDNVWLTDVGRHQVFKFSHDRTLVMTVGERRVPGWDATHFNEPTDVAVAGQIEDLGARGDRSRPARDRCDPVFLDDDHVVHKNAARAIHELSELDHLGLGEGAGGEGGQ